MTQNYALASLIRYVINQRRSSIFAKSVSANTCFIFALVIVFCDFSSSFGDVLANWNFDGYPSTGTNFSNPTSTTKASFITNTPTLTGGLKVNTSQMVTNTWDIYFTQVSTSLDSALASTNGTYIGFTLNAAQAFRVTNISITVSQFSSGQTAASLFSSQNGFATTNQVILTDTFTSSNTATPSVISFDLGSGFSTNSITYRLYFYAPFGFGDSQDHLRFGDRDTPGVQAFAVSGVPEATTCLYLTLGVVVLAFVQRFRLQKIRKGLSRTS